MQEYYWDSFGKFCDYLETNNHKEVVARLKDVQKYVNGLTDGWYEYLEQIKKIKHDFKDQFDPYCSKQINYFIESIDKMLKKR